MSRIWVLSRKNAFFPNMNMAFFTILKICVDCKVTSYFMILFGVKFVTKKGINYEC